MNEHTEQLEAACNDTIALLEQKLERAKSPRRYAKEVKAIARTFFVIRGKRFTKWGAYFCIEYKDNICVWVDGFLCQATAERYGEKVTTKLPVDIANTLCTGIR